MGIEAAAVEAKLETAFARFLTVYARYGAQNFYGWDDYGDGRNFKGPTFWTEADCLFRFALELEEEFPKQVHWELPVARHTFSDFDPKVDKQERVDLVVSDFLEFVEDETSQERFMTKRHELFLEGKTFPAGCSKTWRFDHIRKIDAVCADARRLARHVTRGHCVAAAVLVVDDDSLFEENADLTGWPKEVKLLLASPMELTRRGLSGGSLTQTTGAAEASPLGVDLAAPPGEGR